MPRFFVPAAQVAGGRAEILGADAAHLARSLRVRPGEVVTLADDAGREHSLVVDAVAFGRVEGAVVATRPAGGEPRRRVVVLQALPQTGVDDAVEALVGAGCAGIVPFVAARSVARPAPGRTAARADRWRALARQAAGLAQRAWPPPVAEVAPDLGVALAAVDGLPLVACALEGAAALAATDDGVGDVAVVVGPEGGLAAGELALLAARGARVVHLGPRVLPARLAGAVATVLLLAASGDLDAGPAAAAPPTPGP